MNPSNINESDENQWQPCEPGSLSAYAASEKQRHRTLFLTKISGVSVLLLAGSLFFVAMMRSPAIEPIPAQGDLFGGISCSVVHANQAAYRSGSVSPDLKEKIRNHLRDCPNCRDYLSQIDHQDQRSIAIKRNRRFIAIHSTQSETLNWRSSAIGLGPNFISGQDAYTFHLPQQR